jgi:UDP-N-acetyl-2-amino-2-deoxyglucuronate dehydrogenase
MASTNNENGKLRFGIVGCGSIGPTHAGALAQIGEAELVAVADPVEERAAKMAKKFAVRSIYKTDDELIADPNVDVVCFCTPSGMHTDGAVKALRAGKHAVVEKPMDISLEACDRMIAAERASGKKLTIISQHRFDLASRVVKDAIDHGKLGKIILAEGSVKWWRTQGYYDSGDWRGTWKWDGGGALMNQGVHTVDVLQWLAGDVKRVYAQTRTGAHERIEVEDIAVFTLEFANGAVGTFMATTAAYDGFAARIDLFGTNGSAIIEGDRLKQMTLKTGESYVSEHAAAHAISVAKGGTASVKDEAAHRQENAEVGAVWGDAHRAQLEDFIAAVREDRKPLIDGSEGRKPVQIILAVYESARTGKPVEIK